MVTSSRKPLSRKIATHSVMKMSEVWRGHPTFMRMAIARSRFNMCGDLIGHHKFSHPSLEPCGKTGTCWWAISLEARRASSTKSNLVASSFGKISFQHMNKNGRVMKYILARLPYGLAILEDVLEVHDEVVPQQSHMWLGLVLFDHTDTSFRMQISWSYWNGANLGSSPQTGGRPGASK